MKSSVNRVLVVDDDTHFGALLCDVFEQANYEVTVAQSPIRAVKMLQESSFDLIITDHRMPKLTGLELVKLIRKHEKHIPIITVSGYLDNDVIRDLIRYGVSGIFMKPLDIYSLLRRADELVHKYKSQRTDAGTEGETPFRRLRSFPTLGMNSKRFADRVESLRGYTRCLVLYGEAGSDFRLVCADLTGPPSSPGPLLLLRARDVEVDMLGTLVEQNLDGNRVLTVGLLEAEALSLPVQEKVADMIAEVAREGEQAGRYRFVLCLTEDLETLYDNGRLADDLYLRVGSTELRIPALNDVPEDVPDLAQQYLDVLKPNEKLDESCRGYLRTRPLPGNLTELHQKLDVAVGMLRDQPIRLPHLRAVFEDSVRFFAGREKDRTLEAYLRIMRDECIASVLQLTGKNLKTTCEVLELPPHLLADLRKR